MLSYNKLCFFVCVFLSFMDFAHSLRCRTVSLPNGRVKVRSRGRMIRFQCLPGFELVGQRFAMCTNNGWDTPIPICVQSGCPSLPALKNGISVSIRNKAGMLFFCDVGYELVGAGVTFCDGKKWNGTMPVCNTNKKTIPTRCDFEVDSCGWNTEPVYDYFWKRIVSSMGPIEDHTTGSTITGHYLDAFDVYGELDNSAVLISSLYPPELTTSGCFVFYYSLDDPMNLGGLMVYVHPGSIKLESIMDDPTLKQKYTMFKVYGQQEQGWKMGYFDLEPMDEEFQIVIEAFKEGVSLVYLTVDDISIEQGENCTKIKNNLIVHTNQTFSISSCVNRCINDPLAKTSYCSCNATCNSNSKPSTSKPCCPDYIDQCIFGVTDITTSQSETTDYSEYFTSEPSSTDNNIITTNKNNIDGQISTTEIIPKSTTLSVNKPNKFTLLPIPTTTESTTISSSTTTTTSTTTTSTTTKSTTTTKKPTIFIRKFTTPTSTTFKITTPTTTKNTKTTVKTTTRKILPTTAAIFVQTLNFKTPPPPYKNVTGILTKNVINKNKTIIFNKTTTKPLNNKGIIVIPITKTTKTVTTTNLPKIYGNTSPVNSVSKTFEHYGRGKYGSNKTTSAPTRIRVNTMENSGTEANKYNKKISTASQILIALLCMAIIALSVFVAYMNLHRLRRFIHPLRSKIERLNRKRSGSNGDMRFLVEDEELEHDL